MPVNEPERASSIPAPPGRRVLTVGELNRRARALLEGQFASVWVQGEISNLSRPSSGHWYFTLKDRDAQLRCAMFRGNNQRLRFNPENGQQVTVMGRLSLYEARGDYQLIAEHMEEAGLGALQRAFEMLKQRLAAEGLFDVARKRPLPEVPRRIAVITSPTGAAIRDVLTVLARRCPQVPVTVLPVAVQGTEAAPAIVEALARINRLGDQLEPPADVIILGRGGGSLEDLWAFNEEAVARAIAASRLPVISAVGHEIDFTIADFVADLRAPTPSAAAELVAPDQREWLAQLQGLDLLMQKHLQRQLGGYRQRLEHLRRRLRHPGQRLREQAQRLDELEIRLRRAIRQRLEAHRQHSIALQQRLQRLTPSQTLDTLARQTNQLGMRLQRALRVRLRQQQGVLTPLAQRLHTVSPLATLGRGYAIVTGPAGIIRRAASIAPGTAVIATVAEGRLHCTVTHTEDATQT